MRKRIVIIATLICFCAILVPFCVISAPTGDAVQLIDTNQKCELNITYEYGVIDFANIEVKLYKIADVSPDVRYTLSGKFSGTGLILNGIRSSSEWRVVSSTLESYIVANGVECDSEQITNDRGEVTFSSLDCGLYFATVGQTVIDSESYGCAPVLISLPDAGVDGKWQYNVPIYAKTELLPPVDSDEKIEIKVVKLWKGDEGRDRPKSVEIEIFRDGKSYKKATLSASNNWTYSWSAENDGSSWTVAERNVPSGYTASIEKRDGAFVLTNTYDPDSPGYPDTPPDTGDTSNTLAYLLLMIASGSVLVAVGLLGKRKSV